MEKYLIVGLGNVGLKYKKTRHNIGFEIVSCLAKKEKVKFKKEGKFFGYLTKFMLADKQVFILKPATYMNRSGISVKAVIDFFKIPIKNILIIIDDVYIPFKEFKLKTDSSSAGHKGLESIEEFLKTKKYARLKVGIGKESIEDVKSYVLKKFSIKERKELLNIAINVLDIIYLWLNKGILLAMNKANVRTIKR